MLNGVKYPWGSMPKLMLAVEKHDPKNGFFGRHMALILKDDDGKVIDIFGGYPMVDDPIQRKDSKNWGLGALGLSGTVKSVFRPSSAGMVDEARFNALIALKKVWSAERKLVAFGIANSEGFDIDVFEQSKSKEQLKSEKKFVKTVKELYDLGYFLESEPTLNDYDQGRLDTLKNQLKEQQEELDLSISDKESLKETALRFEAEHLECTYFNGQFL